MSPPSFEDPNDESFYWTVTVADLFWCAQECKRQESGEMSVAWMGTALNFLRTRKPNLPIDEDLVLELGVIVSGQELPRGYRQTSVSFKDHTIAPSWQEVPRLMKQLLLIQDNLDADEFYWEFERIHPFKDGNGRVGALLWNYIHGSLWSPEVPPEYKK